MAWMREGGLPLPPAFQYLIRMICIWFRFGNDIYTGLQNGKKWGYHNQINLTSVHVIRIKYQKDSGSGKPPSLITLEQRHFNFQTGHPVQKSLYLCMYPIFFPYILNLPEEMAKKVHTDTLLVIMVQGEVCLVLEKRIEKKTKEHGAWSLTFFSSLLLLLRRT